MVWTTAGTNRVCPRCLPLKDKLVGYTDETGVQIPPLHPRCRCAIDYREVGDILNENYRHKTPELPYKPLSEERYQQLIIPLKKMGVTIHRDEETERYLEIRGAAADTIGTHDVLFGKNVTISDILEETHHIRQNRRGMNDDKDIPLRRALNEIDAKEYLLRVAKRYKIPREETDTTKLQLAQYKEELEEYYRRNGMS